jgi:hypothetical protein
MILCGVKIQDLDGVTITEGKDGSAWLKLDSVCKKSAKGDHFLNFTVAERREKGKYGDTHAIYTYDKDKPEGARKKYIGSGELKEWNNESSGQANSTEDDLPF